MTDEAALKRDPVTILHKAMRHLRKRREGTRGYDARLSILLLKQAVADVQQARFEYTVAHWRK